MLRVSRRLSRWRLVAFVALLAVVLHLCAGESRGLEEEDASYSDEYPPELFDTQQKKDGAIVLYFAGMLYMFLALAIVCDECFVPALEVVTAKLDLSPDVAGATFMAAGGSAPEFFTSLIGSTVVESDVGIGTIVGSAVFNVLFVIGCCAFVSPKPLELTWWPLARDAFFYTLDLIVLSVFFADAQIEPWESLILFLLYVAYGLFMKYNQAIESRVHDLLGGRKTIEKDKQVTQPNKLGLEDDAHWAHARNDPGMVQKVVPEQAPTTNGAKLEGQAGSTTTSPKLGHTLTTPVTTAEHAIAVEHLKESEVKPLPVGPSESAESETKEGDAEEEEEEPQEPLEIRLPEAGAGLQAWARFIVSLPILTILVFTVPDPRREGRERLYPISFFMSILWIAGFTYFMIWFVSAIAFTLGVPVHILGLTVLAAGTSVPDLLTSIIVARQGKGDMAVSSSIGSNIFDVTVGLPVPWMLYSALRGSSVHVQNKALGFSIMVLLLMLMTTIMTIKMNSWVMTKAMGLSMFVLYVMFMIQSILVEVLVPNGVQLF